MTSDAKRIPTLGEAVTLYLGKLSTKEREECQVEVRKFARWYGWESSFSRLAGPAVASYVEQLNVSDIDYEKKLSILRSFFAHAKKAKWSQSNLSIHIKAKKGKTVAATGGREVIEAATLTQQRYDELTAELENLKKRSRELVGEIQRAAADKDFRENAPLDAAKEERGHIEGRIKELGQIIKSAKIIQEKKAPTRKTGIGDSVIVCDLNSGEECRYTLVDPREVNAALGKISTASPLGKALLGRSDGETVEVSVPAGKLRYEIKRIER